MKMIKRIAAAVVSAAIAVLPLAVTVSATNEYSKARDGVVFIESSHGAGSGFAIGTPGEPVEYIVTNFHVVGNDSYPTVWFNAATGAGDSPQVVALDTRNDIAILKLSESTTRVTALSICKTENVSVDDKVYAYGFHDFIEAGRDYMTYSQSDIAGSDGIVQNKTTAVSQDRTAPEISVLMTSCLVGHGNSGGPLVNENGQVIGIVSRGIGNADDEDEHFFDTGYAATSDSIINLLNANGISYTLSSAAADNAGVNGGAEGEEGGSETPTDEEADGIYTVIGFIIILIPVAVAAYVIYRAVKKKKGGNNVNVVNNVNGGQFAAPPQQTQGVIICVKGLLAGRSFNVNGSVVIGRNTQRCTICYPIDAQGISGVHCEIRQTANGYEIIDRGSSCGTFLGSGQKLVPDVPAYLPNGTYFYLGSAEQLFQIKY